MQSVWAPVSQKPPAHARRERVPGVPARSAGVAEGSQNQDCGGPSRIIDFRFQ